MSVNLGSAVGRILIDSSGVEQGTKKAQNALSGFAKTSTGAMSAVGVAMAGVGLALVGVTKGAQAAWRTLERGAELEATRVKFERLSASIDTTAESLLGRLQEATNGMMTDAQLMASATDIMSLGLGKTEDQTVRLATVVSKLGWDMQQVILTFANNSKMRLDALGLSVEDVTRRAKELEEQGYSTDAAFDMAVIEAGEAKIALLGSTADTTKGMIVKLNTELRSASETFQATFARELADEFDALGKSALGASENIQQASENLGYVAAGSVELLKHVPAVGARLMEAADMGWILAVGESALTAVTALGLYKEAEAEAFDQWQVHQDAHYRMQIAGSEMEQKQADAEDRRRRQAIKAEEQQEEAQERATRIFSEYGHATDAVTRQLQAYNYRGQVAAETNRRIAEETGYTVYELAQMGMTAEEAMEQTAAAVEAAAQRAQAAFASVQGDYITELPDADEPLITPERTVTVRTQVSGPTEEQRALAARYTAELEKLRETYIELTGGIGTFGMEQETLNARIAETAGEIAHYEGLLAGIPPTVNEVSTAQQGLKVNVDAVRQGIYDQLVAMVEAGDATPEVATAYAVAVGIMSDAQREAALQAAVVKIKIDELATSIAAGMPIDQALADLDAFILKMEQGVTPAAETMATDVPLALAPMSEEMSTQATTAGESVPANIAAGITDNLDTATTAATDAADAITQAMKDAHGIESPSSVFAAIGADDIAGFVQGVEDAQGDAVAAMEAVAQATTDAWDATIDQADGIGVAIMDGVIAGVESRRGALVAKMQAIAREAYEAAMAEINAASPSRLFMTMGQAIIDGVIAGLDAEKDTLYDKLTEIAAKLYRIGEGMFDFRADALAEDMDEVSDSLARQLDEMRRYFGDTAIDNILGMSDEQQAYWLRMLRGNPAYGTPWGQMQLDEAIRLADERNRLNEEYKRQQEQLLKLEEQRARLNFLQMQVDLLNLIRENNLSTDILDGLRLGLDANIDDVLAAMTEAVRQLIERVNDELEIASPSAVFTRIGQQVMAGLGRGISQTREVEKRMRAAVGRMAAQGIADLGRFESQLQTGLSRTLRLDTAGLNPAQTITIYGGYNPALSGSQAAADPLRDLYWRSR